MQHRRKTGYRTALALGLAVLPMTSVAAAQDDLSLVSSTAGETGSGQYDMDAIAAAVRPQDWYPEGYYDLAIAARAHHLEEADASRQAEMVALSGAGSDPDGITVLSIGTAALDRSPPPVAIGFCGFADIDRDYSSSDPYDRYGPLAYTVGQVHAALSGAGYPADLIAGPLATFEKARLQISGDEPEQSEDEEEKAFRGDWDTLASALAERAEARRLALPAPDVGRCGMEGYVAPVYSNSRPVVLPPPPLPPPGPRGVRFATSPANGQIWLINAFAFKVCDRRTGQPWSVETCRWNELETGLRHDMHGRYYYRVVWPDGTAKRGVRILTSPQDVTFRRNGS